MCIRFSEFCPKRDRQVVQAQEDRQWALRKGLEEINKEIELASCSGVACWFPMGSRNERIVRLAGKEAVLLNSRLADLWQKRLHLNARPVPCGVVGDSWSYGQMAVGVP